jgi:hypothetical protein
MEKLNLLVAQGDIEAVKAVMRVTDREKMVAALNQPINGDNDSLLHTVLRTLTNHQAIDLFCLLVEHGAEYYRNSRGEFPWESSPLYETNEQSNNDREETLQYLGENYLFNNYN